MTEIEKFIAWVDDQVNNHGLIQMSSVHFDNGGRAIDVLRAKALEAGTDDLEEIAKSLNAFPENTDRIEFRPYVDDVDRKEYQKLFEKAYGGSRMLTVEEVKEKAKVMELAGMNFLHQDYSMGATGEDVAHIHIIFIDGEETMFTAEEFQELWNVNFLLRPSMDN